jgi:FkbM family methyltransferase
MTRLRKLLSDLRGIVRACGWGTAVRWLSKIVLASPQILRDGDLLAADLRMGPGPFRVRHKEGEAWVYGTRVFASIREIWIRDVYGRKDFLRLPDNALVVDLGANIGVFSTLALAANATSRVIAVEAQPDFAEPMRKAMSLNGFEDRLDYCNAFFGTFTELQDDVAGRPENQGVPTVSEADFIQRFGIERIQYLKVDIEGSEFALLRPESRLLDISDKVAIEAHHWGGDARMFVDRLLEKGFRLVDIEWHGEDCIALATR